MRTTRFLRACCAAFCIFALVACGSDSSSNAEDTSSSSEALSSSLETLSSSSQDLAWPDESFSDDQLLMVVCRNMVVNDSNQTFRCDYERTHNRCYPVGENHYEWRKQPGQKGSMELRYTFLDDVLTLYDNSGTAQYFGGTSGKLEGTWRREEGLFGPDTVVDMVIAGDSMISYITMLDTTYLENRMNSLNSIFMMSIMNDILGGNAFNVSTQLLFQKHFDIAELETILDEREVAPRTDKSVTLLLDDREVTVTVDYKYERYESYAAADVSYGGKTCSGHCHMARLIGQTGRKYCVDGNVLGMGFDGYYENLIDDNSTEFQTCLNEMFGRAAE
ncbi:hypothetical protein [uncultured Fibrobacter sp.]|uniref:hypothetical protein n=1 Tax=uncultured Fibrobacter sp. TaxID=261512 RepID=UPI002601862D|nr:hypothetical protein [uncultured Fibrobacter sp.]